MTAGRLLRRGTAVTVTSVVMATGLATTAWAGTVTVTSGAQVPNTGGASLVVNAQSTYVPGVATTVTVTRHGSSAPQDQLRDDNAAAGSDTHTITASIDYARANPGLYDVTVQQGGVSDSCSSCVSVTGAPPEASSLSPSTLAKGTRDGGYQPFVVNGSGFTKGPYGQCTASPCTGPSVAVFRTGTTTNDDNVVLSQTQASDGSSAPTATTSSTITLRIDVIEANADADYTDDVVVTNSDGQTDTCVACLTIRPRPSVTAVDLVPTAFPGSVLHAIGQNAVSQTVVVHGAGFPADAKVQFVRPDGAPAQQIAVGAATAPQPDGAQQKITLSGVDTTGVTTPGDWRVVVSSAALHTESAKVVFPVTAEPQGTGLDAVDSSTGAYGQGAHQVHVDVSVDRATPFYAGSGSTPHTVIDILGPFGTITEQTAQAGSGTDDNVVHATLDIPEGTYPQDYELIVVNPDGGRSPRCDNSSPGPTPPLSATPNTCVLTVADGPAVGRLNPNTVPPGFTGHVDLLGTNFHTGTNAVHVRIGPATAPFFDGDVTPTSSTKVTVNLTVPPGTSTAKAYDAVLVNNDDKGSDSRTGVFHVSTIVAGNPTPSSAANTGPVTVTLTGGNIAQRATVAMVKQGVPSIKGTAVTVNSAGTKLTATFDLTNRAPGDYDVLVTNPGTGPDSGTGGCSECFTVRADAPTISSVTPASMGAGAAGEPITITGNNLFPGATVTFTNSHIRAVGASTVTAPHQLVQRISIDEGTPADAADTLTVTNTDGKATPARAFPVNTGPTASGIDPSSAAAGDAPFRLTITGSHIAAGATMAFSDPSITATGCSVGNGGTTLACTVTIPAAVATGSPVPVDVAVVNPDKGRGTSPEPLTVTPRPEGPPAPPATVHVRSRDGALRVAWTAPSDDGGRPVSSYTARLRRHASGTVVDSFTGAGSARGHTFTGLRNGKRYDVSVVATNALGSSQAATAHGRPRWVTTLSLRRPRGSVSAGDAVRLHGALHRSDGSGLRGAEITVYRKRAHHPRHVVEVVVTGRGGRWSLHYRPTHTGTIFAVFGGDRADRADRSPDRRIRVD